MSYDEIMARYRRLLSEYEKKPRGQADPALDDALRKVEEELLLNPPPGKAKGLLPDEGEPPDCPTLTEEWGSSLIYPVSEWNRMIADPDCPSMDPFSWIALDQNGFGSCAGDGLTGAILSLRDKRHFGRFRYKLNGFYPYRWSSGGVDRGSTLQANLRELSERGAPTEDVFPRSLGPFCAERYITEEVIENAKRHRLLKYARVTSKEEWGSALLRGYPVYGGYAGHAWYATSLLDTNRFRWKNSWGMNWGTEGFGTLSFQSVMWQYGAYVILLCTTPEDEAEPHFATAV